MKKKIIAVMLVLAMAVGMVAGCGETENVGGSVSESETEDAQTVAGEGEYYTDDNGNQFYVAADGTEYYVDFEGNMYKKFDDVTLNYLHCWDGGIDTADDQYNNEYAEALREKLGITVIREGVYIDETEKLNMLFAGGDMPDIIDAPYWGGSSDTTGAIKKAARDGLLLSLTDYYQNYNNIAEAYEIGYITESYWNNDINIWDGELYVLPRNLDGYEEYEEDGYGVFVRADVAEALGVDPLTIDTPEELYDFMKAADEYGFKDVNGNDTITVSTRHSGNQFWILFKMFSDKRWTNFLLEDDGTVNNMWLSESYCIEGAKWIWRLVNEGMFDVECLTQSKDVADAKFGNGTVLFACCSYSSLINATISSDLYEENPEMRYIPVGPLSYRDGSTTNSLETAGATGSHVVIFPETCSNLDAALTWYDYMSSAEGILLSAGIEGQEYTWDGTIDGTGFAWTQETIDSYAADETAYNDKMTARGYYSYPIVGHQTKWFGDMSKKERNEYLQAWYDLVPVEFPEKEHLINDYSSGYEYLSEADAVFAEFPLVDSLYPALFADTEDECVEMLRAWQQRILSTDEYSGLLEYLTECYNADPDNIGF